MSVYEAVRSRVVGSLSSVSNLFDSSDRPLREDCDIVPTDEEVEALLSPSAHSSPAQLRASGGERVGNRCSQDSRRKEMFETLA